MSTAATVSAFRLRRLASGGNGRSGVVLDTSVRSERVRRQRRVLLDLRALNQDLPLLSPDTRDQHRAIEEPVRHIGVAAHDGVVDEHTAAVRLEDEQHRRLGVPSLRGELDVDPRPQTLLPF